MKGWVGLVGWPCSGRFTHISGHPSAAGRAKDRESSPVTDRRSTTVPRNQHSWRWDLELAGGTSAILGSPWRYLVDRLAVEVTSVGGVRRHLTLRRHVRVRVVYHGRRGRLAGEVAALSRVADKRRVGQCWPRVRLAARSRRWSTTHTSRAQL